MSTNTEPAEPLPSRQSCDRCHGQKLRCSRKSPGKTDPCVRCLRQGARCVYSATLRKGRRPSGHRQAGATSRSPAAAVLSDPGEIDGGPLLPLDCTGAAVWPWEPTSVCFGADVNLAAAGELPGSLPDIDMDWALATPLLSHPPHLTPPLDRIDAVLEAWGTEEAANVGDNIAQLSELSVRLYPLYRSSGVFTTMRRSRDLHRSLIGDSLFESIAEWLVPDGTRILPAMMSQSTVPSPNRGTATSTGTGTNILYETLSASRQLLCILCSLQISQPSTHGRKASTGALADRSHSTAASRIQPPAPDNSDELLLDATGGGSSPPASGHMSLTAGSDPVIRHLVLACHTLILNTYSEILATLQHDADMQHSGTNLLGADHSSDVQTQSQADLRIVMVVQLTSYFIQRLCQAVEAILSALPSAQRDRALHRNTTGPSGAASGAIRDLEIQVQQRLVRLQQTLRL
ncbi:hypothetical protein N7462_001484 [Penicillium macrosclerotiorum]|uniref:uncharacterized protein n=1 Tax=Penicillium macrosclerotiorum TaxID=303699 RepID=UPI0025489CEC|nr:uncharacterized protein N7462_001484 [Penicillium macrosclerotiorum]KAJ5692061.1 hypothetical protein N7462_001484 [Penicillium macrosclerotiorum]